MNLNTLYHCVFSLQYHLVVVTKYRKKCLTKVMLDDYAEVDGEGHHRPLRPLSEREREIFQLIAEGHSNKAIADLLSISPVTVETHRAHILQKLDVHNAAELVLYAVRRGVIS